jgi:glucosyl-dolichyl phosphate glucuronosyltransferase
MNSQTVATSIIICAYTLERWNDLCEAVTSARQQEPPPGEIILVIDHNPELKARCQEGFAGAVIVENTETRGLSGARNSGIAAARGELIAFLDDDAVADRRWLALLHEHCRKPGVLGATSWIEPQWIGRRPAWFPDEFMWAVGCSYRGLPTRAAEVRNLVGGACALRRELFRRVGGFNRNLGRTAGKTPISCEETELCIRIRKKLGECSFVFEPAAVIRHKIPAQRLTWAYFGLRCYAEGLSKAYLATLVGVRTGLSAERSYVIRTLSTGIARNIADAVVRADPSGVGRAAAIIYGLGCTIAGFVAGKLGGYRKHLPSSGARPILTPATPAVPGESP